MVPFWVLIIIWHLIFRVPQKGAIILTTTQMCFLKGFIELGSEVLGCTFVL